MTFRSDITAKLFILAASIISFLVFSEICLRLFSPESQQEYSVAPTSNQYKFYQFDEKLGWSNTPFMNGVQRREEFEYPIRINEYGMRNKPVKIEPARDIFRIAFLGDSFTWGIGVSDEERFTDVIGKLPMVESLNFGVSGYSPVQYYLLLDQVIKFKPNLVVLIFCLSNDFVDNVHYKRYGYYKPYLILNRGGEIELRGYPIINVNKFGGKRVFSDPLLKHSRVLRLINLLIDKIRSIIGNAGLTGFKDVDIYDYPKLSENKKREVDQAVLINKLILAKIKQKLDAAGIPLVVVAAPTKYEYPQNSHSGSGQINTNALNVLEGIARELGIDFIDAVHCLNIHDFWLSDGHYNLQGHKKIAELVENYLYKNYKGI
ncbi:MAG: SGNH/GDSL hydrolase family protein [Candidatus Omnitrophota bacterium]|jgi:lysophospholipase L1-like esterase